MPIARRLRPAAVLLCSVGIAGWVVWSAQRQSPPAPVLPIGTQQGPQPTVSTPAPEREPVFLQTSKSGGRMPRPAPAVDLPPAPVFLPTSKSAPPLLRLDQLRPTAPVDLPAEPVVPPSSASPSAPRRFPADQQRRAISEPSAPKP